MALRVPRPGIVRPGLAEACQSGKMATLSNTLYFTFRLILRFCLTHVSSAMIILNVVQCFARYNYYLCTLVDFAFILIVQPW